MVASFDAIDFDRCTLTASLYLPPTALRRFALRELDILDIKFSPTLWHTTVDKVIVNADESLVFLFKNGREVTV